MSLTASDEYTLGVTLTRSLTEDADFHNGTVASLVTQVRKELQAGYEEGVAGSFNIDSITVNGVTYDTAALFAQGGQ